MCRTRIVAHVIGTAAVAQSGQQTGAAGVSASSAQRCVHNVVGVATVLMATAADAATSAAACAGVVCAGAAAAHRRRRLAGQIRRRTGAAVQIRAATAVRRGTVLQAHVDGAVAVVAEVCNCTGWTKWVLMSRML